MKKCPTCKSFLPMKNKLKVGDFVRLSPEEVLNQLKHFNENYLRPSSTELDEENYNELHFFLEAHLTKKMPIGTVIDFAAEDRYERGRLNLRVHFKHRGQTIVDIYNEDDLKKVRNVPFKKR